MTAAARKKGDELVTRRWARVFRPRTVFDFAAASACAAAANKAEGAKADGKRLQKVDFVATVLRACHSPTTTRPSRIGGPDQHAVRIFLLVPSAAACSSTITKPGAPSVPPDDDAGGGQIPPSSVAAGALLLVGAAIGGFSSAFTQGAVSRFSAEWFEPAFRTRVTSIVYTST